MSITSNQSNECLLALGELTVAFSEVESFMKEFIGYLLEISYTERQIVTSRLRWNDLLNQINALYQMNVSRQDMQDELYTILKKLKECNTRRNSYIHSDWILGYDDEDIPINARHMLTDKGLDAGENEPLKWVRPDEIRQLVNELRRYELDLQDAKRKLKKLREMNPPPDFIVNWHANRRT